MTHLVVVALFGLTGASAGRQDVRRRLAIPHSQSQDDKHRAPPHLPSQVKRRGLARKQKKRVSSCVRSTERPSLFGGNDGIEKPRLKSMWC